MKMIKFFVLILLLNNYAFPQQLQVGLKAPDFTLPYATSDTIIHKGISLSEVIGKKPVIIAFYPADWSPGCTKQLCSFRDDFEFFNNMDVEILAISGDQVWSHHNWAKQQNYKFKLLSDPTHKIARLYNSFNEEKGYNKRTIFLIDKNGIINYIDWQYITTGDSSLNKLKHAINALVK